MKYTDKGSLKECLATECNQHESLMVKQLRDENVQQAERIAYLETAECDCIETSDADGTFEPALSCGNSHMMDHIQKQAKRIKELEDVEESLKAVDRALGDVDYRGSYADGILYLKQRITAQSAALGLARKALVDSLPYSDTRLFGGTAKEAITAIDAAIAKEPK